MFKKLMIFCVFCVWLSACGLENYPGGDLPTQARLNAIHIGDTKEKVTRILGTPASDNPPLPDGTSFLIYAQNMKTSQAFFDPKEIKRDVYVYYFNVNNILTEQKHLTLANKRSVGFEEKTTPAGGREMSVFEQIANNFGRYNAGGQDSSVRR